MDKFASTYNHVVVYMLIEKKKIIELVKSCAYIKTENVGTSELSNDFQAKSCFLSKDK